MKPVIFSFALMVVFVGICQAQSNDVNALDRVKAAYDSSAKPASMNDFANNPNRKCAVFSNNNDHPVYSAQFEIHKFQIAPPGPLFPNGEYFQAIVSTFRGDSDFRPNSKRELNLISTTPTELKVNFWGEGAFYGSRESWSWMYYDFRKSGDLLVFKVGYDQNANAVIADSNKDYGYCWTEKETQ